MSSEPRLVGKQGKSILDSGYIYAPYIPMVTTPTFTADDFAKKTKNSPLEDLVEGVFEEEIKAGELKRVRKDPPADGGPSRVVRNRHKITLIRPEYFSTVKIADLA